MLNPFPELLTYSFFAPTILRVAAALVFLYMAYRAYARREEAAKLDFPMIGRGAWIAWFAIAVYAVIGLALAVGYYTQIAAILGGIGAIKGIVFTRRFGAVFPLSRAAFSLLLVILLSLLLSGAGALAYDLPL